MTLGINNPEGFKKLRYAKEAGRPLIIIIVIIMAVIVIIILLFLTNLFIMLISDLKYLRLT